MNYYEKENRLDKINKSNISNSILKSTWLGDNSISYGRPLPDEEVERLLSSLSELNKLKQDNTVVKNKLFSALLWYAAYCSSILYSQCKKQHNTLEYGDVLAYSLERLSSKLDDWDADKSNGASFYTRYSKDINYYIRNRMKCEFNRTLDKLGIINRRIAAKAKLGIYGYDDKSASNLSEKTFRRITGMSKRSYFNSTFTVLESESEASEDETYNLLSTACDEYTSNFDERIICNIELDRLLNILYSRFKKRSKFVDVWKDYKSGEITLKQLSEKHFNPKITRERVRQMIKVVDDYITKYGKYFI